MDRLAMKQQIIDEIIDHLDGLVADDMAPQEDPAATMDPTAMGGAPAPEVTEEPVVPDEDEAISDADPADPDPEEEDEDDDEENDFSFARNRLRG